MVTRNDLEHERYRLVRPGKFWTDVTSALGEPDHAGPLVVDTPRIPVLDERTLAHPDAADEFPVVAAFDLDPSPAATTVSAAAPIILAGSGDGVVDLAGARLLDPDRPLLYAATLDDLGREGALDPAMFGTDPWWVFTDTNRQQGRRWSTVSSNLGALEANGSLQLDDDPGDEPLDLFGPGDERLHPGAARGRPRRHPRQLLRQSNRIHARRRPVVPPPTATRRPHGAPPSSNQPSASSGKPTSPHRCQRER